MAPQPGVLPHRQAMGRAGLKALLLVLLLGVWRIGPTLAANCHGTAGSAFPVAGCLRGTVAAELALACTFCRGCRLPRRNPLGIVSLHCPATSVSTGPGGGSNDKGPPRHSLGRDLVHREPRGTVVLLRGRGPAESCVPCAQRAHRGGNHTSFQQRGYCRLDRCSELRSEERRVGEECRS